MSQQKKYLQFGAAVAIILLTLSYLAYTGVEESKSYYVTIAELRGMGDSAHSGRQRIDDGLMTTNENQFH